MAVDNHIHQQYGKPFLLFLRNLVNTDERDKLVVPVAVLSATAWCVTVQIFR